jgi:hypothetical protein
MFYRKLNVCTLFICTVGLLFLGSCGGDPRVPEGTDTPLPSLEVSGLQVEENPANHLSARVTFTTERDAKAVLRVRGPEGRSWTVGPEDAFTREHELWVLGMYADSSYSFTAEAWDADGASGQSPAQPFRTGPLPDDFPPIELRVAETDLMQPGITLFNVYRYNPRRDFLWGLILAVDDTGRVVWYYRSPLMLIVTVPMGNGNILYNFLTYGFVEIDMKGREVNAYLMLQFGLNTMHHDIFEMPDGGFLSLGTECRAVEGYPSAGGGTETYNVVGDLVFEFSRDAKKRDQWSLFDYLDPHRVRPGFLDETFWGLPYFYIRSPKDWTHANSVIYDASDNSMILSLRNQDWLVKIDRESDELLWRFGEEGDFFLEGDGEWPYHQHSPKILPGGNILLYDNGNGRPTLEDGEPPFSRVVEYSLDTRAMTARQVWEYRGVEPYFSAFLGDADRLENGNILITDGAMVSDPFIHELDPENHKSIRIVEVTREETPRTVFELIIDDRSAERPISYTAYRAARIPDLRR